MANAKDTKVKSTDAELEGMFATSEDDDLLNGIEDDESEAWMPTEKNEGIVGKVVGIGQAKSDFALPGQDPMVPVIKVEVTDSDGEVRVMRVTGYAFLLRKGIEESNPAIGDTMAFKFLGKGQTKKGQPINKYGVAIKRASA